MSIIITLAITTPIIIAKNDFFLSISKTEAINVALETIEATIQDADLEVVLVLFDQETKSIADKMYL